MPTYLVRHREDKTVLGIFSDANAESLWWTVDAFGDPGRYEYTKLTRMALVFQGDEPKPADWSALPDTEDDVTPMSWGGASSEFDLESALYRPSECKWRRFPSADEEGGGAHQVIRDAGERRNSPAS